MQGYTQKADFGFLGFFCGLCGVCVAECRNKIAEHFRFWMSLNLLSYLCEKLEYNLTK